MYKIKISKNNIKIGSFLVIFITCLVLTIVLKLNWLTLVSCIFGILYIFFLSERSVYNFLVGLVSTLTYTIVAYRAYLYGEVLFYLLFDLPMIFVSFLFWKKHLRKTKVVTRELSHGKKIIIILASVVCVLLYSRFLLFIGGRHVIIDATSTVTTVIATILMALRYREQWFMWIVVYLVSIIMWISAFDILMLIMSISCFAYSFVGYVNWRAEDGKSKQKSENNNEISALGK